MIRADRVQQRIDDLDLNPFAAARQAGLEPGYVRDLLRGKIKEPGAAKLNALATVLRCSPDYLMGLVERPGNPPGTYKSTDLTVVVDMPIRHEVGGGNWLATDEQHDQPLGSAPVALFPQYAAYTQWLDRVRGDSMNKIIPDGALVHVVDAIEIRYAPKTDDLVVVERTRAQGAFIERSVKQVLVTPGGVQLWPRSHNPRWDQPLNLSEGAAGSEDMEVRISAKVLRAYLTF